MGVMHEIIQWKLSHNGRSIVEGLGSYRWARYSSEGDDGVERGEDMAAFSWRDRINSRKEDLVRLVLHSSATLDGFEC